MASGTGYNVSNMSSASNEMIMLQVALSAYPDFGFSKKLRRIHY